MLPEDFLKVLLASVKLFPRNPSGKHKETHMKGTDCPLSFPNHLQAQTTVKLAWDHFIITLHTVDLPYPMLLVNFSPV